MTIQLCDVCGKKIQGEMDLVYVDITPAISFGPVKTKRLFDLCGCCAKQMMLFLTKNEKSQERSETLQ